MTSRHINLLLRASGIALCAIAILSIATALLLPLQSGNTASDHAKTKSPTTLPSGPVALAPLDSFAGVWSHPLRRPLTDPENDAQSPEAIAIQGTAGGSTAPPPITLVGTIGESLAMLRGPDGNVSVLKIGDQLDGVQLLAVRPAQVDVRYNNRTLTLDKPKEAGAGISIQGEAENRVEAHANSNNQP